MVGGLEKKKPRIGANWRVFALSGLVAISAAAARVRAFVLSIALLVSILATVGALVPESAEAAGSWYLNRSYSGKKWSYSFMAGTRYLAHYNRAVVLTTPPDATMAEAQFMVFYKKSVGFYLTGAKSVISTRSYSLGAGFRFPFLTLAAGRRSAISGISMQFVVDGVYHSTEPNVGGRIYTDKGLLIRYGGGIFLGLGKSGLFLDLTMMATRFSDNFFIAPLIGIGYHF